MKEISLKKTLEDIACALVDKPEAISVTEQEEEECIRLTLRVDPDDMGKIIGKQGKIARALRTVVRAAATKDNKKVIVEIIQ